ncbi:MAG: hypothetical protein M0Q21_10040 [Ignavibacteriaceae bacterium]|nr:hypothetical protein [Ignavibacteriaceae bacterium]
MKNRLALPGFLFIFFFTFLLTNNILGQGKIIKASEANALFGPVLKSEKINVQHLKMILRNTPEHVLVSFKNGRIHILDKNKKEQFPSTVALDKSDVLHLFSTSVVEEIINLEKGLEVMIEERANNILSITTSSSGGDAYTLEYSMPPSCPPYCN